MLHILTVMKVKKAVGGGKGVGTGIPVRWCSRRPGERRLLAVIIVSSIQKQVHFGS